MNSYSPNPISKLFAPVIFGSLALLSVGMAFGPAQADEPGTEAPRVQASAPANPS